MMAIKSQITELAGYSVPLSEQIDVRGGKATYGQMSDLGKLLNEAYKLQERGEYNEAELTKNLTKNLIRILHPDIEPAIDFANARYALNIADAVQYWKEQEGKLLKYKPSTEEKQAGYESLTTKTGATGVAITLAEKFGVHNGPDEVFEWSYSTVFMILYTDLERYKYQKRLNDLQERKRKSKERSGRFARQ